MNRYESTLNQIEGSILPTAAAMLDALLDAAQGARPGIDAIRYADQLRLLAHRSERATAEISEIRDDMASPTLRGAVATG